MKKEEIKDIELFVLDMDGTIYLGNELIEGSKEFIECLQEKNKRFLFFTNNSSKTVDVYYEKLSKLGFNINKNQLMTSGDVMIEYLKHNYNDSSVYLVATPPTYKSFKDAGINLVNDNPDIVVITFDTTLNYEKLDKACRFIRNGSRFLATHLDINCPTADGFMPDCGAMCALITKSTGVEPRYTGKPFKETVDMIESVTGVQREKTVFIGDRLYTDVATGVNNGAKGVLVLSGEAGIKDIKKSDVKPDLVFDKVYDMKDYL